MAEAVGPARVATPPLRQLYAYLTEGCNLACRHCWLAPPIDPDGSCAPTLAVDDLLAAVTEALPLGLEAVKLTGGEPLLHPEIEAVLDVIAEHGLELAVETNGVLLTPAVADRLEALEAAVSVSLDGVTAATHDAVRGVAGSFEDALRAVRLLAERELSPQVIFSLMRANAAELPALIDLAAELGAGTVKVNVVQPTARGAGLYEAGAALPLPEVIALGRRVMTELAPAAPIEVTFDVPPAFRPLSTIDAPGGRAVCGILTILGLLPTGEYALCGIGAHVPELVFGKVGAVALAEAWATEPVLARLREGLPDRLQGICGRCLMRSSCLGECIAQNYYRRHDLFAPYWFCEQAAESGLFPETRLTPAVQATAGIKSGSGPTDEEERV